VETVVSKATGKIKNDARVRQKQQADAAIAMAHDGLGAFAVLSYPKFELATHIRLIIDELERLERGEIDRLMIFMPPRHGKSLLTSQLFPSWFLGRHPDRSIIASSYGSSLATDFGRKVRNLCSEPLFRSIFPKARIADDSAAVYCFNMLQGGAYFALGAGGSRTGRGADLLLLDDLVKNREEAYSASSRKNLAEWYESVAYTRLSGPGAAVIIVQTRWHQDDICGRLLREHPEEGWTVLNLPAIAETDEGWRKEGEPLWSSV
jgi:hypothetical protein